MQVPPLVSLRCWPQYLVYMREGYCSDFVRPVRIRHFALYVSGKITRPRRHLETKAPGSRFDEMHCDAAAEGIAWYGDLVGKEPE